MLFVAEGLFGFGLYWPFLLILKDKGWSFWVAFLAGIFLSVMYSQKIGLMSLYLVGVLTLISLFVGSGRGLGKWVTFISLLAACGFDLLFGLHFSIWEALALVVAGLLVGKFFESTETIKINF